MNIFAGITDLAEFARLLVQAADAVPELRVPIVARLIGRNLDDARQILGASALAVTLEPDLDRALALTLATLDAKGAQPWIARCSIRPCPSSSRASPAVPAAPMRN